MGMKKTLAALLCATGLMSMNLQAGVTENFDSASLGTIEADGSTTINGTVYIGSSADTTNSTGAPTNPYPTQIKNSGGDGYISLWCEDDTKGNIGWDAVTGEPTSATPVSNVVIDFGADANKDVVSFSADISRSSNGAWWYRVQSSIDNGTTWQSIKQISGRITTGTLAINESGLSLTGVDRIRINVWRNGGTDPGEMKIDNLVVYNVLTTGLTATAPVGTDFDLSWDAATGATGYTVVVSTKADLSNPVQTYTPVGTSQSVTGLSSGSLYYCGVTAVIGGSVASTATTVVDLRPKEALAAGDVIAVDYASANGSATNFNILDTGATSITSGNVVKYSGTAVAQNVTVTHTGGGNFARDSGGDNWGGVAADPYYNSEAAGDIVYAGVQTVFGGLDTNLAYNVRVYALLVGGPQSNNITVTGESVATDTTNSRTRFTYGTLEEAGLVFSNVVPTAGGEITIGAEVFYNAIVIEAVTPAPAVVEITGYEAIEDVAVRSGDTAVDTLAEVQALLPSTVTIDGTSDTRDVTWTTDSVPSYDNSSTGTYVFTATLGAIPEGYTDDPAETVTANVIVTDTFGVEITDGADSQITSPYNLSGDDMTFMTWVNVPSGTPLSTFFTMEENGVAQARMGLYLQSSTAGDSSTDFGYFAGSGSENYSTAFPLDSWVHLAIVTKIDGTTAIYINGVSETGAKTNLRTTTINNALLKLNNSGTPVNGAIYDEVAVFSRALTSAQITDIYNSGTGAELDSAYAGMELYWRFEDEPQASTVADSDNDADSAGTISGSSFNWVLGKSVGETVTPAIGLEVSLEGTELVWAVEDEVSVQAYEVTYTLNGEPKTQTVLAVDADFYTVDLPEGATDVKLVVVDKSGYRDTNLPEDGNVKIEVYDLEEGWNLIAITSEDADLETLKDETVGVLWGWNGSGYEVIETAKATDAVWVYSPIAKQVYISGTKSNAKIKLNLGWNMVGPVENGYIPEKADTVYSWSAVYDLIAGEDKVLIGGKGYWIFSL